MTDQEKTKDELIIELQELRKENNQFKQASEKYIAERKLAEDISQMSEANFRNLAESLTDGIVIGSADGQHLYANGHAAKLCGYTNEEMLRTNQKDLADPEAYPLLEQRLKDRIAGKPLPAIYETIIRRKDGTSFPAEIIGTPILWQGQKCDMVLFRNITERKHAEKALRKSEEKWRILLQNLPDYVALYDRDEKYLFLNHFAEGFSMKDIEGKTYTDFLADDSKLIYEQAFKIAKQTNSTQYVEHSAMGNNKNLRYYESNFVPIFENNEFSNMMIIARDITERKKAEEDLKWNDAIFNQFMEYSPIYVFFKDENISSLRLSRNYEKLLGKPMDELLGKTMDELFPSDLAKNMIENDLQILREGIKVEVEEEFNNLHFSTIKFPIQIEGKTKFLAGFTIDITEHKKAEEAILKSKKQYDNLVAQIPVGVYILRTKPDYTFALEYASPVMAKILDLSVENLLAHNETTFKAIHPDDLESFVKLNQEGIILKRPFDWKGRAVVKGVVKWLHISSLPQQQENGDILWHGLIVDITEQMRDEEEIKNQNEKLQELNATKDKFFSIIAHDLRSPFNSFLGLTQIMAEELPSLTMAQIQEIAVNMSKSATNLYRLLENLLHWSSMQQGIIPFNPETVKLLPVADESITMILEQAKVKGIEINCKIPDDLVVFADTNLLQTIIRNLVSNAVKFTSKRGKVSITAKATTESNIEISVHDTGIGMSQKLLGDLFKLDVKTSRKGTNGEPSTGLGLLLCKEFIEKHGGQIWAESEVGKGSSFHFTLPCRSL